MTSSHIFFIPGMIMIGMFLGFLLGARAVRNQVDLQQRRDEEREVVRASRAAKRAASGEPSPAKSEPAPPPVVAVTAPPDDAPKSGQAADPAKKQSGGKGPKGKRAG